VKSQLVSVQPKQGEGISTSNLLEPEELGSEPQLFARLGDFPSDSKVPFPPRVEAVLPWLGGSTKHPPGNR